MIPKTKVQQLEFKFAFAPEGSDEENYILGQLDQLNSSIDILTWERNIEQKGSLPYRVIDLMIEKINEVKDE